MRSSDRGRPEAGRIGIADTPSAPQPENFCVACDHCVKGTHFGSPELFCLHQKVRDAHAAFYRLIGPRRLIRIADAWILCAGQYFTRAGDAP